MISVGRRNLRKSSKNKYPNYLVVNTVKCFLFLNILAILYFGNTALTYNLNKGSHQSATGEKGDLQNLAAPCSLYMNTIYTLTH